MRYRVLACDYDGTLAHGGVVGTRSLGLLERLLSTGRKLVLVTGRELSDLRSVFPDIALFQRVVAENGALLCDPATRKETRLGKPIPERFVQTLQQRGVNDLSVGHAIVATHRPSENIVLATIRDLGLELQTIFNREAVMILPAGVNKATGLAAALNSLGLTAHEVVAVGDAENDHAFLELAELAVAVGNALPALQEHADWVTAGEDGDGVAEVIEGLLSDDLASREEGGRRRLLLGVDLDGEEVFLSPRGPNVLIAGPSGSGKSTVVTGILERLSDSQYQFCIIDPEGDYENLEGTVTLGRVGRGPMADEVLDVLAKPDQNLVVNLLGLPVADRPPFFLELLPRLHDLRAHTGRPHWLIVDEAHHLVPASWQPSQVAAVGALERSLFVTVHPDQIAPAALRSVGLVLAVGESPETTLSLFGKPLGLSPPGFPHPAQENVTAMWQVFDGRVRLLNLAPPRLERQRHARKYAIGELPPDRSFYFRGPDNKLNLRAQNLQLFLQLGEGVDEETWLYHLRRGDYSEWFRTRIKDEQMAAEAEGIEREPQLAADESRARIRELIERHYMPPTPVLPIPDTDAAGTRSDAG